MLDPNTGKFLENHTCLKCRFRHPKVWPCAQAATVAAAQRSEREPAEPFDEKAEAIAQADAALEGVGLPTYSQLVLTVEGMVVEQAA